MPRAAGDARLDSWKEIAAFLKRGVRTVQRWEREEGLPVHRHQHRKLGSVYAFEAEVARWWESRRRSLEHESKDAAGKRRLKLLVLPFENLSGDPAQEYLSDGLTEEMITQLAGLEPRRLAVIARATAMHYKGGRQRVSTIAQELALDYVLEGSVRRSGNRVRITAQLISAKDETHIWAQNFDRDVGDVLALQTEAAAQIAGEIHLALASKPRRRQIDPEAYEQFLRGRYHLNRMTPQEVGAAIPWFQKAVQQDPNFPLAYASLAHACTLLAIAPFDALPPRQAMPRAASAVEKALTLDPSLPEAHAAQGVIRHHYDWNWKGAEQSYQKAIQLNPAYSGAHLRYAWLLLALGRTAAALKEVQAAEKIAQEVDPFLLVVIRATRAAAFYFAREYDHAITECRDAMELDSSYFLLHYLLGRCYARKGDHRKAIAALMDKASTAGPPVPLMATGLALAHAVTGATDEAAAAITQLEQLSRSRYIPSTYIGILYAGLNDHDRAFQWLEKAYEERADGLTLLNVDPMVDGLRADRRFQDLLRRIGLH
ncbi:MAG TPA: tetratricopeptide repeat protein [Terriglobales bacterium]|jgi:TolB-like protein/Flp pilus assembly protein TadD